MVKLGSKGSDVVILQGALIKAGYKINNDGVFGPATEAAVRDFQFKSGLTVDGIAGSATYAALHIPLFPAPTGKFPNKQTTLAAAEARYGLIDWNASYWSQQGKWIHSVAIPEGWFPNWKIGGHLVKAVACNIDMPLMAALTAVHDKGLGNLLVTYDGCLNIRPVRGSTHPSTHSYGLAIDLNADLNPLAATSGGFYNHPDFVKCFTDQGFTWGGNFHGRKDSMHFSYAWE